MHVLLVWCVGGRDWLEHGITQPWLLNSSLGRKLTKVPQQDPGEGQGSWVLTLCWGTTLVVIFWPGPPSEPQLAYADIPPLTEQQERAHALFEASAQFLPLPCHLAVETWHRRVSCFGAKLIPIYASYAAVLGKQIVLCIQKVARYSNPRTYINELTTHRHTM